MTGCNPLLLPASVLTAESLLPPQHEAQMRALTRAQVAAQQAQAALEKDANGLSRGAGGARHRGREL